MFRDALSPARDKQISQRSETRPSYSITSERTALMVEHSVGDAKQKVGVLGFAANQKEGIPQVAYLRLQDGEIVLADAARLRWLQQNTKFDEIRGSTPNKALVFYKEGKPVGLLMPIRAGVDDPILKSLSQPEKGGPTSATTPESGVSVIPLTNEKDNVQLEELSQPANREASLLSVAPRGEHAQLAERAPANAGAKAEGYSAKHSERLSKAGQADSTTVRNLQDQSKGGETPRGLQQAASGEMVVPSVPPDTSRRVNVRTRIRDLRSQGMSDIGIGTLLKISPETVDSLVPRGPNDPDTILEQAVNLPSTAKQRKGEAGFTANPIDIAKGVGELMRAFPEKLRDLGGGVRLRSREAKAGVRNIGRETLRAIAEAQLNPEFKKVYTGIVTAQEEATGRLYDVRHYLHQAWKPLFKAEQARVAEVVYQGNERGRTYSQPELEKLGLNEREQTAYQRIRQAEDTALDARRDQLLARVDDALTRIKDPDQIASLETLRENITDHYDRLKSEGYVSLQRIGDWAVVARASDGTIHYDHADSATAAQRRAREFRKQGLQVLRVEKTPKLPSANYDYMTPEQFEHLVQESGANPSSPEVQQIRDKVYSNSPSKSYQLKRDFKPGYERTKDSLTRSIIRQGEVYTNTYKNNVGRLRAERALLDANVDEGLMAYSKRFIEDEVAPRPLSMVGKTVVKGRQLIYIKVLAADIGQFYLNAVAQPTQMNWPYFARAEFGLRGPEPEIYFGRGWKLLGQALIKRAPAEFQGLFQRAVKEGVGQAELTRSLAEAEVHGKSKIMHALSFPMQLGERVTRGQALAEAYLVGKEKLKLSGENLYRFMADSTYATQTRMGGGEAPGIIRMGGDANLRRAGYQFHAFSQMYLENFGLNLRSDLKAAMSPRGLMKGQLPLSTARTIAGTVLAAGLKGLPLAGAALIVSKAIFGNDWEKVFSRLMANLPVLRDLALYGVLSGGEPGGSIRMNAPFSDVPNPQQYNPVSPEFDPLPSVPMVQTASDILVKTPRDLYKGDYIRAGEDIAPRALRGPLKAYREQTEELRTRGGHLIASRKALTLKDKLLTIFNVQPAKEVLYYQKQRERAADKAILKTKRMVRRIEGKFSTPEVPQQTSP